MIQLSTARARGPRMFASAAALLLVSHFAFTALHVGPPNPLGQQLASLTDAWINPFFNQNWELFAPDPVNTDMGVLVQGRGEQGDDNTWIDITTPLLERKLHNPFPDHLHYVVAGAAHNFLSARQTIVELPAVLKKQPEAASASIYLPDYILKETPPDLRNAYEFTLKVLTSVAAQGLAEQTGFTPTGVRVRLVTHEFPRWSERANEGVGDIVYSDLPWLSVDTMEVLS